MSSRKSFSTPTEEQKDLLLGTASHELKNNIASLKAYAQLLEKHTKKLNDEKTNLYLEKVNSKIDSLTSLVQDLLDMTKIRSNKLVLQKTPVDVDTFIKEVIEDLQFLTKTHSITIQGIVNSIVHLDEARLEQVLSNLIRNAIKYSPDKKDIYVCVEKNDKEVIMKVQDFGIGIPEDKQAEIFEPFARVNEPGKPKIPGFGLGLFVSSQIITLHGGEMTLESKEGEGSTFIFTLPVNP